MSLKRNIFANYIGQGWSMLMAFAFIPLYIKYLGIEAYGLVGILTLLQAWMTLLDMGMTPTLNREMARFKAGAHSAESIRDLLRSMELVYVAVALLIAVVIWSIAPWLAGSWLKLKHVSINQATLAISIMGFVLAARLWEEVYKGVIQGMQQQVWLNSVQAGTATLRWGGALCLIAGVSPTIQAFFIWQGLVSVFSVALYARRTYKGLPLAVRGGRFSIASIRRVGNFASGMAATTLLALLLTQIDKLLLSKLLPLEQFGYYMLAAMLCGGLAQLVAPLNAAVYPRFTELITRQDAELLTKTYHESSQLMSLVIIAPALALSFFAEPVLMVWIGDTAVTKAAAPVLSLLVLGTMLNALMNVPYMLQLAYGWSSFAVRVNLVAVAVIIPSLLWAVPRYGSIGAAWAWLILNLGYLVIGMHFMYRRLLSAQKWRWYRESVVAPLAAGIAISYFLAHILPAPINRVTAMGTVFTAVSCICFCVALSLPGVRQRIGNFLYAEKR